MLRVHAAGWLERGLSMSYEKFVMDLDRCGMIHRLLEGLTIDANGLGADAFVDAGPGRAFLDTAHTLANLETANYLSTLADTTSYEQWSSGGSLETQQRANLIWKQMLAEYEPPQIDPSVDASLLDFMDRRRNGMPDRWH